MITLEQVKLLETKVAKAIDYVNHLTGENAMLREKLSGYQTKIDELEVLIKQFREDQGRIEGGILSALDRLNQFEDAIEKGISQIIPKEEKPAGTVPSQEKDASPVSSIEIEAEKEDVPVLSFSSEKNEKMDADVYSETTPADDSDEAIMAALEAEEKAVKAKDSGERTAELDIF